MTFLRELCAVMLLLSTCMALRMLRPSRRIHPLRVSDTPDDEDDSAAPLASLGEEFKLLGGQTFVDTSAVDSVLADIKSLLALRAPSQGSDASVNEALVAGQMAALLGQLVSSGDDMRTELTVLKRGLEEGGVEGVGKKALGALPSAPAATLFSSGRSPVAVVYGSGPVGQSVLARLKALEPAVRVRRVEARTLLALQDSELSFALRDARTVIVAADRAPSQQTGWFKDESASDMDAKGMKRLLNAVMVERNRGAVEGMKVVFLGRAAQERKGLAAVLLSGDAGSLESDAILQCQSRGLDYAMVKVGSVIPDDAPLPKGLRNRNAMARDREIERPIAITTGVVEASEVTRLAVATEALLRAATHPQRNSTFAVLSSYCSDPVVSEEEWNDEFLKIDGPELLRVPLIYSSVRQMVLRLHGLANRFTKPGSGLVTPVECSLFVNGIRFEFRPLRDTYKSSKEEKASEKMSSSAAAGKPKAESLSAAIMAKQTGYISPEKEAAMLKESTKEASKDESKEKKRAPKPEGGLEVIVDALPYFRVRVRRCSMATDTIVKEESEALLLREVSRAISVLENDYKIILTGK